VIKPNPRGRGNTVEKIVLLTMNNSLFENETFFDRQVKAIMSVRGAKVALVCSKVLPDTEPYSFAHFGDSKDYSTKEYFDNFSNNSGKIAGLPNIDEMIIIETISMDSFLEADGCHFNNRLVEYIQKNSEIETDKKIINTFVEAPFAMINEPARFLQSVTFGLINFTKNTRFPKSENRLGVYCVRSWVFSEIYLPDTDTSEKPKVFVPHVSLLVKIQKLFSFTNPKPIKIKIHA
jgi:hypothetical protein